MDKDELDAGEIYACDGRAVLLLDTRVYERGKGGFDKGYRLIKDGEPVQETGYRRGYLVVCGYRRDVTPEELGELELPELAGVRQAGRRVIDVEGALGEGFQLSLVNHRHLVPWHEHVKQKTEESGGGHQSAATSAAVYQSAGDR